MKTAIDNTANAHMFLFYYRSHTANEDRMWAMEGRTAHIIHIDGEAKATLPNRWGDVFYGFIEMPDGMVRIISATFVVQPNRCYYTNFQTVDMVKDEARRFYALHTKNATWRGSVVVEKNHQFI